MILESCTDIPCGYCYRTSFAYCEVLLVSAKLTSGERWTGLRGSELLDLGCSHQVAKNCSPWLDAWAARTVAAPDYIPFDSSNLIKVPRLVFNLELIQF